MRKILITPIIGIILYFISIGSLFTFIPGMVLFILDTTAQYWIPILIVTSILFFISFIINIILYTGIVLKKSEILKNPENDFSFYLSSFIFWFIPALFWIILINIYKKEAHYIVENNKGVKL